MIKILFLGLFATAAVWFVTSKDHVVSFIEKDLTKRVSEAVDAQGENRSDYTIAGRDVILFGSGEQSAAQIEATASNVRSVSGVERVYVINRFADPANISRAVVALIKPDRFTIAAHLDYNGSELNLIGNGTAATATTELLTAFGESHNVEINDNMSYENSGQEEDWMRALTAWIELLPTTGPGWIVFDSERIIFSMEDQKAMRLVGEKLNDLELSFDVNYRRDTLYANANNTPIVIVPSSSKGAIYSISECNQKLSEITQDNSINFKTSSDEISTSSLQSLVMVRDTLLNCEPALLTIAGHTDSLGDSQYNLELSRRRAELVMDEFITLGVDAGRLRAIGFGEERPISSNETRTGRWLNRRIELQLE